MVTNKLIIAGSRSLPEEFQYRLVPLSWKFRPTEIVCGMAKGPDLWGKEFGESWGIEVVEFPAQWDLFGKRAGYVRNEQMADYADALLAFWDGKSRGTKHMIDCMSLRKKPFHVELCL